MIWMNFKIVYILYVYAFLWCVSLFAFRYGRQCNSMFILFYSFIQKYFECTRNRHLCCIFLSFSILFHWIVVHRWILLCLRLSLFIVQTFIFKWFVHLVHFINNCFAPCFISIFVRFCFSRYYAVCIYIYCKYSGK